jgi:type II secretory pathway component PulF
VKPGFKVKRILFQELGLLLRSGITLPSALQKLENTSRGQLRKFAGRLRQRAERGDSFAEIFAEDHGLSRMESAVLRACSRGGRLDDGCSLLAEHLDNLHNTRRAVLQKLTYPLFVLHFGVFALAVPKLLGNGGMSAFLTEALGILAVLYLAVGVLYLLGKTLGNLAAHNAATDAFLGALPVIGGIRSDFALSRFCAIYEMQLDAGVNVLDSLSEAGHASQSALLFNAIQRALPKVREGHQPGEILSAQTFSDDVMGALQIGESTGRLGEALIRLANEFRERAVRKITLVSEWIPRLVYIGVLLYIAARIVLFYQGLYGQYMKLMDF